MHYEITLDYRDPAKPPSKQYKWERVVTVTKNTLEEAERFVWTAECMGGEEMFDEYPDRCKIAYLRNHEIRAVEV